MLAGVEIDAQRFDPAEYRSFTESISDFGRSCSDHGNLAGAVLAIE
jgi:hypothetical protein